MSMKNVKNRRGFTLVELMVSLAVFSIVMTVSVGTLLVLVDLNAKAQALYSATTNLSFALDSMAREVRTGYHYYCSSSITGDPEDIEDDTNDCPSGGILIAFIREEDGNQMLYRLNASAPNGGVIEQRVREVVGSEDSGWLPITADDVVVTTFDIVVTNSNKYAGTGDTKQPTIDLKVEGYVENGLDTETDFFIQTRIIQRRLDLL